MSINSDDRPWPQALGHEDLEWPSEDQRVLVPFREAVNQAETSMLGASIAFGSDGDLYLLHAVDPGETADSSAIRHDAELKMEIRDEFPVPVVQAEKPYSSRLLDSFVASRSITATVVDREETSFFSLGRDEKTVAKDCHTVVGTRMDRFDSPSSILVPVAKGPHSGLATRVAEAIARSYDCWVELFHVIAEDAPEREAADADRLLDAYEYRMADDVRVDHHVTRAPDPAEKIIEHSQYHDTTILGAPEKGKLRRFLFGYTTDEVKENPEAGPILTAHRNTNDSVLSRWI
ncbi:universal stress protein [Halobacterium wangiae]|uniref:universal stress protein n=1 Tax=Halobacterium wangiae TaxID=2902623 RepID=UPI001E406DCF|nr:universal stress protein [Halobacterium wangiae]